jgi:2-iminobutanoate/2-iminopropanoate deaminase
MKRVFFDKTGLSYSQAVKISEYSELLFISGQVPEKENGTLPESFEDQCRQAWHNVKIQLNKAGLDLKDLIKVTIYLSDKKYRDSNSKIRQEILKDISPALTIIIAGIYEEEWLLEIEAIAGK